MTISTFLLSKKLVSTETIHRNRVLLLGFVYLEQFSLVEALCLENDHSKLEMTRKIKRKKY